MEIYHQQHFSLLDAAIDGQLEVAKRLIQEGHDLEERSENDTTALLNATMHGHPEIAELLIQHGADVNCVKAPEGITPLMIACSNGQEQIIERLMEAGAKTDIVDNSGNLCFHYAVFGSSIPIIQQIYAASPKALDKSDDDGFTPLLIAAKEGRAEVVSWLLEQSADIQTMNAAGESVLYWLITAINDDEIQQLQPHFDLLHEHVLEEQPKYWIKACMLGRSNWIEVMLRWGLPINRQDRFGNTGLHYAVAGAHQSAIQLLIDHGADSELQNEDGISSVALAKQMGYTELQKILQ